VAALVSPRVREAVTSAGVELVTYPDLVSSQQDSCHVHGSDRRSV